MIDETERKDLTELIQQISGENPDVSEVPNLAIRLPFKTPGPEIHFEGNEFCLTGKFLFGPRKKVAAEIESKGGRIGKSVTMGLNFLVIGTQSSRDWKHGNFGRKIEKAVEYQDDDILTIVSEEHWASHL